MQDHGGNIGQAIAEFGGDLSDWVDLSTGINGAPYPVGQVPEAAWSRLPDREGLRALERAAQSAYGTTLDAVAVAGAQAAIQLVPRLMPAGQAAVLAPTYNEHAATLRSAGWQVREAATLDALEGSGIAVVVNPNNPDGKSYAPDALAALAEKVGILIVDESFIDPAPHLSVTTCSHGVPENVIVLRSFGKFYGLAGLRLGFVLAAPALAGQVRDMVGPWPVSGMAIDVAERALGDAQWAQQTRENLLRDTARLDDLARGAGWDLVGGTTLFRTYATPDAVKVQRHIATHRIWTRIFPYSQKWIRLGLPAQENDWSRLSIALRP